MQELRWGEVVTRAGFTATERDRHCSVWEQVPRADQSTINAISGGGRLLVVPIGLNEVPISSRLFIITHIRRSIPRSYVFSFRAKSDEILKVTSVTSSVLN